MANLLTGVSEQIAAEKFTFLILSLLDLLHISSSLGGLIPWYGNVLCSICRLMGDGVSCPCPGISIPVHMENKCCHSHQGRWPDPPAASCSGHSIFAHLPQGSSACHPDCSDKHEITPGGFQSSSL